MNNLTLSTIKEIMSAAGFTRVESDKLDGYCFWNDDQSNIRLGKTPTIRSAVIELTAWYENKGFEKGKASQINK